MMNRRAICILIVAAVAHAMTDPATGIAFKPSIENREIVGVGVRKKGPIKVKSIYIIRRVVLEKLKPVLTVFAGVLCRYVCFARCQGLTSRPFIGQQRSPYEALRNCKGNAHILLTQDEFQSWR